MCAASDDDGRGLQNLAQFVQRQIGSRAQLDVAEVMNARVGQDLAELFTHALFEFVLVEVAAVLDQAAGLDVAVDEDDFVTGLGQFAHAVDARGAGANCDDEVSAGSCFLVHCWHCWFVEFGRNGKSPRVSSRLGRLW